MGGVVIRRAAPSDLDSIVLIDDQLFPNDISYDSDTFRFFLTDYATVVLIAEVEKQVTGFIVFRPVSAEAGCVITIDVSAPRQRRGIGSSLLNAVENMALKAGYNVMTLQTAVANSTAITFYEAREYKKSGRLTGYYGDGSDAWQMIKKLS